MISYIKGEIAAVFEDRVIVETGGVGFGIFMPPTSLSELPEIGLEVKIHTFMHVKEDGIKLFGFLTADDLEVFRLLIGVNGIGPKGGLQILSQMTPDDLRIAVLSGDTVAISKAPGIGKKTAEKLIIELRDKLKLTDVFSEGEMPSEGKPIGRVSQEDARTMDAVQALVALGYGNQEAIRAVRKVEKNEEDSVEVILRQALKYIGL